MATQIKTRILNKYDLLANYQATNFVPLKGEICIVEVGSLPAGGAVATGFDGTSSNARPIVGLKVGDGVTAFNSLPWVQAAAGDVSKFVKDSLTSEQAFTALVEAILANAGLASDETLADLTTRLGTAETDIDTLEASVNTGADSLSNLRTAINNVVGKSTDTKDSASVVGAKKYADSVAATAKTEAVTAAGTAADAKYELIGVAAGLVSPINTKIGTTSIGSTSTTITSAIKALQDSVTGTGTTAINTRVGSLETTVGNSTTGLVKQVNELGATLAAAIDNNGEGLDSIRELANWIDTHGTEAAGYADAITALEGKVNTGEQTVTAYVAAQINALNISNYATKTYADQAETDAVNTAKGSSTDASSKITIYGARKYAEEKASAAQTAATSAAATDATNKVNALADGAVATNASNITALQTLTKKALGTSGTGTVVKDITRNTTNGDFTVTKGTIGIADMSDTDVFIFYCGKAPNASGEQY